jgi:hypothetical protein
MDICAHDNYFVQKRNAYGVIGLSSIQKCTCAMRMFAYGQVIDACNEYCKIRENTTFKCLRHFVKAIKEVFELEFFKKPTRVDLEKQLRLNVEKG